jgi:hypothetical protein
MLTAQIILIPSWWKGNKVGVRLPVRPGCCLVASNDVLLLLTLYCVLYTATH